MHVRGELVDVNVLQQAADVFEVRHVIMIEQSEFVQKPDRFGKIPSFHDPLEKALHRIRFLIVKGNRPRLAQSVFQKSHHRVGNQVVVFGHPSEHLQHEIKRGGSRRFPISVENNLVFVVDREMLGKFLVHFGVGHDVFQKQIAAIAFERKPRSVEIFVVEADQIVTHRFGDFFAHLIAHDVTVRFGLMSVQKEAHLHSGN